MSGTAQRAPDPAASRGSRAGFERGRRASAAVLATLLLAGLLLACAGPGGSRSEEQTAYSAAVAAAATNPDQGIEALRAYVTSYPDSKYADEAGVRLAELLIARGDEREAMQHLAWVLRHHAAAEGSDRARILLAGLLRERGRPDAAYRTLSGVRLSLLERDDRVAVHRELADLAGEAGDRGAQLRWLSRVRGDALTPGAEAAVDAEMDAALAAMSDEELARTAEQLEGHPPAGRVGLQQAERAMAAGDRAAAERFLAEAAALSHDRGSAARLGQLERRLEGPLVAPGPGQTSAFVDAGALRGTLGVVLPLSGPLAQAGRDALQGMLLATGIFDAERGRAGSGLRLLVRDSGGSPDGAARAVADLAGHEEVSVILGPLTGAATEAAGGEADRLGVPVLSLTRRGDLAGDHPQLLRFGLSPRAEAELLADYAVSRLGLRRVAILYPRDAYGRLLRALFWDAVEARGGVVAGVASYDVDATDFGDPIRKLTGFAFLSEDQKWSMHKRDKLRNEAKRRPPEKAKELREAADEIRGPGDTPLPPFVDFDALFVPDGYQNAGLIAPALAFHEVRGVRLLGPAGWNDPELIALGGDHVDGAVFTGLFHLGSERADLAEFERRFVATFGSTPDPLAVQAFDAANLVVLQLARGVSGREPLRAALLSGDAFAGVSGTTRFAPDGNAERRPHLLGVDHGEIVSVDETGLPPFLRGAEPAAANRGALSGRP